MLVEQEGASIGVIAILTAQNVGRWNKPVPEGCRSHDAVTAAMESSSPAILMRDVHLFGLSYGPPRGKIKNIITAVDELEHEEA